MRQRTGSLGKEELSSRWGGAPRPRSAGAPSMRVCLKAGALPPCTNSSLLVASGVAGLSLCLIFLHAPSVLSILSMVSLGDFTERKQQPSPT